MCLTVWVYVYYFFLSLIKLFQLLVCYKKYNIPWSHSKPGWYKSFVQCSRTFVSNCLQFINEYFRVRCFGNDFIWMMPYGVWKKITWTAQSKLPVYILWWEVDGIWLPAAISLWFINLVWKISKRFFIKYLCWTL